STSVHINMSANQVRSTLSQLLQTGEAHVDPLARASEGLGQLSAAARQITAATVAAAGTTRQAGTNAGQGADAVRQVALEMNQLRGAARDTATQVRRMAEHATRAAGAGALIDDVAEWAGMLSLNASLQAAVAGEHGPRYAVIADVAERLASRAGDARQ